MKRKKQFVFQKDIPDISWLWETYELRHWWLELSEDEKLVIQ